MVSTVATRTASSPHRETAPWTTCKRSLESRINSGMSRSVQEGKSVAIGPSPISPKLESKEEEEKSGRHVVCVMCVINIDRW